MIRSILAISLTILASLVPGPARATIPDPTHPGLRLEALVERSLERGILPDERGRVLKERWARLTLAELPADRPFEDGLIDQGVAAGLIDEETGRRMRRVGEDWRLETSGMAVREGVDRDDGTTWFLGVVGWMPWLGGLAMAAGLLILVGSWLVRAPRSVQCVLAGLATAGFWAGARASIRLEWVASGSTLALAGCVASVGTLLLFFEWWNVRPKSLTWALLPAFLWGAMACGLPSTLTAHLAVLALTVALAGSWLEDLESRGITARCTAAGLVELFLAYGILAAGIGPMHILVRSLWGVAVVLLLAGPLARWEWGKPFAASRWQTWAIALLLLVWGLGTGEGLFVGSGLAALLVWTGCQLQEFARPRLSEGAWWLMLGITILAATRLLEHHWTWLAARLLMESF